MSYQHQHHTTTTQQPLSLSRSKGSNTSTTSTSSISVIVGKTFEATTHPTNGTQQIIEVTKYKRLSDGYIYKETKLRSLEEVLSYDNDDDSSNVVEERVRESSRDDDVENVGHHHRRVSSGAVTARIHNMKSQVADPPAANNGGISMRNLGPQHPLRQITNQQQQPCPPSSISPQRHNPMKPNNKGGQQSMYPEQEVVSTFSSSYSSNTLGEQSAITEEHEVFPSAFPHPQQQQQGERRYRQQNQEGKLSKGGYGQNGRDNNEGGGGNHYFDEESESYVEEYTYENDAKEYDAQAWQHQQQLQQQEQGGRDNVEGWNPFGTDNSIADDSIQLNNRLPSKQQKGNKSANKKLSVSTFFNSGNQYDDEEDNSPIDLKGDDEEETPNSSGGGGMFSRSKQNKKLMNCNCRNISICAMLLVVVGIVVTIGLLVPSIKKNQSPSNLEEEEEVDKAPSCIDLGNIDLQIVISSTDSNVEDVNSWSLVRANENGTVTTINSLDDLPEVTNEDEDVGVGDGQQYTYKNCVEPGLYTFTISDSAGNGLGGGELNEDDSEKEGKGSSTGYYITANDVTLGVSSFFFHEEKMTFTLPFDAEEVEDTSDETADEEEMDTVCTDDFFLAIKTDGKPSESTWNVIDNDTQEEVLSGGPYEMEWTVYTHRACLPNGHYTFNMFDEGEDGVCCDGGKGFFVLQKDGKTIVNSNGEFGSVKSVDFMLGSEEV